MFCSLMFYHNYLFVLHLVFIQISTNASGNELLLTSITCNIMSNYFTALHLKPNTIIMYCYESVTQSSRKSKSSQTISQNISLAQNKQVKSNLPICRDLF